MGFDNRHAEDGAPVRSRSRRKGGLLLLVLVAIAALAASEGLRSKVLDLMFGAEEEFDYASTTAPATPEPVVSTGS